MFEIFTDPGIMLVMLLFIAFIVVFVFLRNFKPSDDSCIMDYDSNQYETQQFTPVAQPLESVSAVPATPANTPAEP
jgi:hypothetical protein